MSWSLFKVTSVDTEPATKELRRIADALEVYLRVAHNYHLTPPKPLRTLGKDEEEPTVAYATDESTALADLVEEFERASGKHPEEDTE